MSKIDMECDDCGDDLMKKIEVRRSQKGMVKRTNIGMVKNPKDGEPTKYCKKCAKERGFSDRTKEVKSSYEVISNTVK